NRPCRKFADVEARFPALGVGPFLGGVDHLVVVVAVASASGGRRVSPGGSDWAPLGHIQWGRKSKPSAFVFLSLLRSDEQRRQPRSNPNGRTFYMLRLQVVEKHL